MTQQTIAAAQSSGELIRVSPLDDDLQTQKFVNQDMQALDLDLFASKWFDYRHLTPFQATRLYIQAYSEVYKRVFAENIDRERAKFINVLDLDKLLDRLQNNDRQAKRQFSACWRGRQMADVIGMPYDIYVAYAFEFRMRFWNQRYLPQPQHLYNATDVERIQSKWLETQEHRLFLSDHPAYRLENYAGIAHQNDYHEWLIHQAYLRHNPHEYFARFIKDSALPSEKVQARVQPFIWERVVERLN